MDLRPIDERRLSSLKNSVDGQTLISVLVALTAEEQYELDLNSNPNDVGSIGLKLGMIRAYRRILEMLHADYDDSAEIENPGGLNIG